MFGLQNALDYLIEERLFHFVAAAEQHPEFATELPHFLNEIPCSGTPALRPSQRDASGSMTALWLRSLGSPGGYDAATNYADSTVTSGTTYVHVVPSADANGVESAFSNQATAVVPTP